MFGYIIPDKANLYIKDFQIYNAFYCSLCKALAKEGNQFTRLSANYDATFFSIFIHSILKKQVKVETKHCYLAMKKKNIVKIDDLTRRIADVSVLLLYYSIIDDIIDGKKGRRFLKLQFKRRAKKAEKREPNIANHISISFEKLRELEKTKSMNIDEVADTSGTMLRDIANEFIPLTNEQADFIYGIGRIVYLFDAIDDVEEDTKRGTYNPIILNYGECKSEIEYLQKNKEEIEYILDSTYKRIVQNYDAMDVVEFEGILSNIVYLGIKAQIDTILSGESKSGFSQRI